MSTKLIRRPITAETRVLDEGGGIVEYVASDETLDSYREVILASGWRFNHFKKNSPFVDSHDYSSVEKVLGKVIDFSVQKRRLVEVVQWAKDVPENRLAQLGWRMTVGGFLRAVSVGFQPTKWLSQWDTNASTFYEQAERLGLEPNAVRTIYQEQEQLELSAVILGANPNALIAVAKGYKSGAITDGDLEFISRARSRRLFANTTAKAVAVLEESQQRFLQRFEKALSRL